jgi:anthranilate phosphoribosyltransferase
MKEIFEKLSNHHSLSLEEAYQLMIAIGENQVSQAHISMFITILLMRPATIAEMRGFRKALMELAIRVDLSDFEPIDLCGTGGDGKNTFNISTLSAFVVAGAGIPVAKHGNYGVSSAVGSSNVLEYLGVEMSGDPAFIQRQLDQVGISFLHAPLFHPALRHVGPVRKSLGIKTIFNQLGPLVNPCSPQYQCTGVFNLETLRMYAYFFQEEKRNFKIIHALDGYDEVSLTGKFKVISAFEERLMGPEDLGLERISAKSIEGGGSLEATGKIFVDILEGKGTKEQEAVVCANSALAIRCYMNEVSIEDAVLIARDSIQSGKALKKFKKLVEWK